MEVIAALFPQGWAHYLAGGLVIGAGVALLYVATGRLAGMSSVFSSSWSFVSARAVFQQPRWRESRAWRLQLALGLVIGAALWWLTLGPAQPLTTAVPAWRLALGGLVAGFGARLAGGCTSGHGICGIGSLKLPSLLAVLTFMATGFITAQGLAMLGAAP
ncbi:MAG: YeeE/YedE family protein [Proteobacteria bacterium]|nr:YeeE/YedE family protein [Pseudomonadota bacterium]